MTISTELSLEAVQYLHDDRILFDLHFALVDRREKSVTADIEVDPLKGARVVAVSDTLALRTDDRIVLSMAAYKYLFRYFGDGPTGGRIRWVRWLEPDLTHWLRDSLYRSTANRIIRTLQQYVYPSSVPAVSRRFTESLEK